MPNESVKRRLGTFDGSDVAVLRLVRSNGKENLTVEIRETDAIRRWKSALSRSVHRGDYWEPLASRKAKSGFLQFRLKNGENVSLPLHKFDLMPLLWGREVSDLYRASVQKG